MQNVQRRFGVGQRRNAAIDAGNRYVSIHDKNLQLVKRNVATQGWLVVWALAIHRVGPGCRAPGLLTVKPVLGWFCLASYLVGLGKLNYVYLVVFENYFSFFVFAWNTVGNTIWSESKVKLWVNDDERHFFAVEYLAKPELI